ncbi:E3 ISG15--protein ligase HERC5, partial [Myotis davidii]
ECIKLGKKMKIHSVDQGAEHMLILSSDGKPFEYNYSIEHERLQCYSFFQEKTIIQITCGDYHSLALSKGDTLAYVSDLGKVFSFGSGEEGQLGNGGTQNQLIPLPMKLPSNEELKFGKFYRSTGFGVNTFVEKLYCGKKRNITTSLKDNLLKHLPFSSPHREALEIFFLLPECPVMHDYNNWESLVVPFAEAVCEMNDKSSEALEEYWASLHDSTFMELVQMFKRAITAQLRYWAEDAESNSHIKVLLEMLKKLHRVNQTKFQLPENIFQVNELAHCLDFYEDARRRNSWKKNLERRFRAVLHLAGIVEDGGSSLGLLPTFNLRVRRSHLIEDVLSQLSQFENEDLRMELMVSFSEETGYEPGGVRTEFFYCLFEGMTRPEYGMFMYPKEATYMWFPVKPKFEKKRYFFFGILCGLILFNGNVANIPFPLALFKKLLDQTPSLEDLKELSPVLGRSLQILLDDESADFEEVFYVHFNVNWDRTDVDLIPNGSCIIVNQTNKTDYVSKYVDYIFNISVKAVYEEFQRGFYKVCDKEIIDFFHPEELKDMIIGNTDYDWETFEKNARYGQGYDNSHPTIVMFWKALHKLTLEEKKKFLVFLTGTDRIQVKGLKSMKITFCCPENMGEKDPIRALTCFSLLYLPKYSTMERLEEALQVAINSNRGFG